MRIARVGALALLVALLAASTNTATAASSSLGTTVTIGSPVLSATRVFVTVPVNVSCSSSTFTTVSFENVFVTVTQASGQSIASGTGFVAGGPPFTPLPFPCDDATHTVLVTVPATGGPFPGGGVPFHGGLASATANVHVEGTDAFGFFQFDNVSEGPDTVVIVGGGR